jgi:hypothetical protein
MSIYIAHVQEVAPYRDISRMTQVFSTEREAVHHLLKNLLKIRYILYSCKDHYDEEEEKSCHCYNKIFHEIKNKINTEDELRDFVRYHSDHLYNEDQSYGWTFFIFQEWDELILTDTEEGEGGHGCEGEGHDEYELSEEGEGHGCEGEDDECLECKNSEDHCRDCSNNVNCKSKNFCCHCNKD